MTQKFRLVTRSDFDGLVCAVLLRQLGIIDAIKFVHPKDMQDGLIEIGPDDISTNLPYVPGVHLSFDHHASEIFRIASSPQRIIDPKAPSAARVVYDYYGGPAVFPATWNTMMAEVDRADSAAYGMEEILNPQGWTLLNYIMDARTGLGRFHNFRISNYNLMMELIEACRLYTIDEILELPDVKERTDLYFSQHNKFRAQIERCSTIHENLVVFDPSNEEVIYAGNRFLIYAVYPQCNISIYVLRNSLTHTVAFALGHSIINRTSRTNVGMLCLEYGGGGHRKAGTCQVAAAAAEGILAELFSKIVADG